MRELRSDFNPVVAPRRERSLLVQRLRALLQDERHQSTSRQAQEAPGKRSACVVIMVMRTDAYDEMVMVKLLFEMTGSHRAKHILSELFNTMVMFMMNS